MNQTLTWPSVLPGDSLRFWGYSGLRNHILNSNIEGDMFTEVPYLIQTSEQPENVVYVDLRKLEDPQDVCEVFGLYYSCS